MNIYITILIEFLLIALCILTLFKFRKFLGLAPLYILLGAVQYIQALSTTMISFEVLGKFTLYPGSVILFSAVLFAVLLIYIKEGVASARVLIVGIIISNFILSALFEITYQQESIINDAQNLNTVSAFLINYKFFITGTIILLLDFILLAIIYQFLISRINKIPFFLVLFLSLFLVLMFDAFAFNFSLRYGTTGFSNSLISHIIGKSFSALIFSIILYVHLKYIESENTHSTLVANQDRDIFSILNISKKYIKLKGEKEQVEQKLTSQLETTLNHISDGFVSLDTNWCYTYVNIKGAELLGRTPKSLIGKHIWTEFPEGVGLPFYDAYYKAVETQQTIYFQEYYKPLGRWFENRIYPSPEGLTIYFTDITVQKKADEENQILLSLIETSDDFIGLATLEGKPIYINRSGKEMLGLEDATELPTSSYDLFPENYKEKAANIYVPEMIKTGKWNGETQFKNIKTGAIIPMEMSGFIIKDPITNKPIALGNVATDISERKQIENELLGVKQNMEAAIRIGKIGYWSWDIAKDEVNWSDLVYEIYDVDRNTPIKYNTVLNCIHPADRDFHDKLIAQRIKDKSNAPFEYRVLCIDKSIKHVMVQTEAIENNKGEVIKFQGTVIDISKLKETELALKESEYRLRTILETEPECIKQLNAKGELIYMNPAGLAMLEADSLDMVKGQQVLNLILPEHQKAFKRLNSQIFKGQSGLLEFEIKGLKGTNRWLETHAVPLKGNDGNIISLLGVTRDITERRKTEEELEKHRNNLEKLVKIRTEEVNSKNTELERMNKLFVGRELRMKELKNIIKELQLKNDN